MPSLDLLVRGTAKLGGPLAQLGLGRDGTFYVIAAGRANHAGGGRWRGIETGNSSFIGIECENTGLANDIWPEVQLDALRRGTAAILKHVGADASMACGHKEYRLPAGEKIDPLFSMPEFRERVAAILNGTAATPALIPAVDGALRPTLRRGMRGELVMRVQAAVGVEPDGVFGPDTEAAIRRYQRARELVPDGIVGPRSWAAIYGLAEPAQAAATAGVVIAAATMPAAAASTIATPPRPSALPGEGRASVSGGRARTPDGTVFAVTLKRGFYTLGKTSVASALEADPGAGSGLSESAIRVVAAVASNEGLFEAINSWDAAFLSVGIQQWTTGVKDEPGELAGLLERIRRTDAAAFDTCFGQYGLGTAIPEGHITGYLTLGGATLAKPADKAQLRSVDWAYRFWRAAHHPAVRRAQIAHAIERIGRFAHLDVRGHPLQSWVSSELGMAMLLDQHVNRPGHVPATLTEAVKAVLDSGAVPANPADWSEGDEHRLIERYIALRGRTSMTDQLNRARRLFARAERGALSNDRGSFR
jgi:peptidoglycan hydrolase-like protein with peptidoglycan-binding domain